MTKHGKSLVLPAFHPLDLSQPSANSEPGAPATTGSSASACAASVQLYLTGRTLAKDGQGAFHTFGPVRAKTKKGSRRTKSLEKGRAEAHVSGRSRRRSLLAHQPSSAETKLIAAFIGLLRNHSKEQQPLVTLGDWITSIPARIGSSEVVTLAAELFVNSSSVTQDDSHSARTLAMQTKGKALKQLRLSVNATKKHPAYDLLLATKLHYASEVQADPPKF